MSTPLARLDVLRRRVRDDPGSRYFLGLAEELMRLGERDEALQVLEAGLAARPGQVGATVAKARCLIELGRPLEGWAALEPVLRRDPTHLVASKLAVELWLRVGDLEQARASLERYAPLGAADPELVRFESRLGELEETRRVATSTPADAPIGDDELVTVTLGNLYLLQGHRAEAERIFRRILRDDPDHRAARQALARALAVGARGARQDV
jgi:predicted Zn-dependent protease